MELQFSIILYETQYLCLNHATWYVLLPPGEWSLHNDKNNLLEHPLYNLCYPQQTFHQICVLCNQNLPSSCMSLLFCCFIHWNLYACSPKQVVLHLELALVFYTGPQPLPINGGAWYLKIPIGVYANISGQFRDWIHP